MLNVYTDGACSHNGTWNGGWGVVVVSSQTNEVLYTFGGGEEKTTNNRMEIMGVLKAAQYLEEEGFAGTIHTDSAYVYNAITKGWLANWKRNGWQTSKKEPVKNKDLWEEVLKIFMIDIKKVKGHSTDEHNNMADAIAVEWRDKI